MSLLASRRSTTRRRRLARPFRYDSKNVDLRESLAVLALLTAIPANALAAAALAELLARRRSCERIAEALVRWTREA
jgi:hypothetical protein